MEDTALSAIRTGTGAASGIATKHMARPDASIVGIIGTGHQAATQLEAICAVPKVRAAKVYSREASHRAAFAAQMAKQLGLPVESNRQCVEGSDIVITITNSAEPVLNGRWLSPGAHVNAAGSNSPFRREVDEATITCSGIVAVDDLEQAKIECGELILAADRGAFRWEQAREIRHVVAGMASGLDSADQITLFESQGVAIEDIAAARHVYHAAKARSIGKTFP